MILVDTSVWVEHLRVGHPQLKGLLDAGRVHCHPFVIGELACGDLRHREETMTFLDALPKAVTADHSEVIQLLTTHRLGGRGIGWIDVHLLASARLSEVTLWTLDQRLAAVARSLHVAADVP